MTFGDDPDHTKNTVCVPLGTMIDGGWYMCPVILTGKIFSYFSANEVIQLWEAMAFSEEAIQMNAGAVSKTGYNYPNYPIENSL